MHFLDLINNTILDQLLHIKVHIKKAKTIYELKKSAVHIYDSYMLVTITKKKKKKETKQNNN